MAVIETAMSTDAIVSKVWSFCTTLRDDGVSYGDYLEQFTYLIFLKMADEYGRPPYRRNVGIPKKHSLESPHIGTCLAEEPIVSRLESISVFHLQIPDPAAKLVGNLVFANRLGDREHNRSIPVSAEHH